MNYAGGKYRLLPQIVPLFPESVNMFMDLFCGGANVGVNVNAQGIVCNDTQKEVIELLDYFKNNDIELVLSQIDGIIEKYGFTKTSTYGYDHYGCDSSGGVAKLNRESYLKLRSDYNSGDKSPVMFYSLIIFAFSNQIRFNRKGEFNMPVNKRDFNNNLRKNLIKFVEHIDDLDIKFINSDFRGLKMSRLKEDDFVYADPPYLISTATYNEQGGWTEDDEKDLLSMLDRLDEKGVRFALSNITETNDKKNTILIEWAKKYTVHELNHSYGNSNYQKKDKKSKAREVLITNY